MDDQEISLSSVRSSVRSSSVGSGNRFRDFLSTLGDSSSVSVAGAGAGAGTRANVDAWKRKNQRMHTHETPSQGRRGLSSPSFPRPGSPLGSAVALESNSAGGPWTTRGKGSVSVSRDDASWIGSMLSRGVVSSIDEGIVGIVSEFFTRISSRSLHSWRWKWNRDWKKTCERILFENEGRFLSHRSLQRKQSLLTRLIRLSGQLTVSLDDDFIREMVLLLVSMLYFSGIGLLGYRSVAEAIFRLRPRQSSLSSRWMLLLRNCVFAVVKCSTSFLVSRMFIFFLKLWMSPDLISSDALRFVNIEEDASSEPVFSDDLEAESSVTSFGVGMEHFDSELDMRQMFSKHCSQCRASLRLLQRDFRLVVEICEKSRNVSNQMDPWSTLRDMLLGLPIDQLIDSILANHDYLLAESDRFVSGDADIHSRTIVESLMLQCRTVDDRFCIMLRGGLRRIACLISDLKRGVHDGDEACLDPLLKLNKTRKNAEKVVSAVREKLSKFAEALLDFSGRLTQGLRLESASSSTFLSLLESIRDWWTTLTNSGSGSKQNSSPLTDSSWITVLRDCVPNFRFAHRWIISSLVNFFLGRLFSILSFRDQSNREEK